MNIFEFKLSGDTENDGVFAVSIVKQPAMESRLVKLSKEEESTKPTIVKLSEDEEMVITGAALIPDKMFFRNGKQTGTKEGGYAYFSKETIREITKLFLKNNYANAVTLEHDEKTDDVSLFEVWIVADDEQDKARALGFDSDEAPVGTMMLSYQVHDEEIWESIKSGELNGFSIEAFVVPMIEAELSKMSPEINLIDEMDDVINIIDEMLKK